MRDRQAVLEHLSGCDIDLARLDEQIDALFM